jgi:hypothetical protein
MKQEALRTQERGWPTKRLTTQDVGGIRKYLFDVGFIVETIRCSDIEKTTVTA